MTIPTYSPLKYSHVFASNGHEVPVVVGELYVGDRSGVSHRHQTIRLLGQTGVPVHFDLLVHVPNCQKEVVVRRVLPIGVMGAIYASNFTAVVVVLPDAADCPADSERPGLPNFVARVHMSFGYVLA